MGSTWLRATEGQRPCMLLTVRWGQDAEERPLQHQVGRGSAAAVSLSFRTTQEMNNAFPVLHGRKLRWHLGRPLALLPQLTLPQGGVGVRRVTCARLLGAASGSSW